MIFFLCFFKFFFLNFYLVAACLAFKLGLALPIGAFPMAALVWFTSRRDVMGEYRNRMMIRTMAIVAAIAVLALNVVLLAQTFGFDVPGLP